MAQARRLRVIRKDVHYASADEVHEKAKQWSNEVLLCRIKTHRFTVPITAQIINRYNYIYTVLGCEGGCGVVQHQEMSMRGHVFSSWLAYPKDEDGKDLYLATGMGLIAGEAKDALRAETVNRVFKPKQIRKATADKPRSRSTRIGLGLEE